MEQHWTKCAAVSKASVKLQDDSVIRHLGNPATQQQRIHMLIKQNQLNMRIRHSQGPHTVHCNLQVSKHGSNEYTSSIEHELAEAASE